MKLDFADSLRRNFRVCLLTVAACLLPATAPALTISERVITTYSRGDVRFSCIMIDGGAVPISPPDEAKMSVGGGEITFSWPESKAGTSFKDATPAESSLIDKDGKCLEQAAWEKVFLSQINPSGTAIELHDFKADIMQVNHWKMGAIAYDYQLGGTKWTNLLLVWRCVDGSTIAVKVFAQTSAFEEIRRSLYQNLGSAMLLVN